MCVKPDLTDFFFFFCFFFSIYKKNIYTKLAFTKFKKRNFYQVNLQTVNYILNHMNHNKIINITLHA